MTDQSVLDNRADIAAAGDPEPVRTPQDITAQATQNVNQKRAPGQQPPGDQKKKKKQKGPQQSKPQQNPFAQFAAGLGSLVTGEKAPQNPLSPIDWEKQYQQDASSTYWASRGAWQNLNALWGKTIHDTVPQLYDSKDIKRQIAGTALTNVLGELGLEPMGGLAYTQMTGQEEPGVVQAAQTISGTPAPHPGETPEQAAEAGVKAAPQVGAEVAMPETLAGKVGLGAALTLPALLDPNQNPQTDAVWAILGATMMYGRIPGGRQLMGRLFGRDGLNVANNIEKALAAANGNRLKMRGDPMKYMADHLNQDLNAGGYPGLREVVAEGGEPGRKVGTVIQGPTGEMQVQFKDNAKVLQKALQKVGISASDELAGKIAADGPILRKVAQDLIKQKNYGQLFADDLERVVPGDAPLRDPAVPFAEIVNGGQRAGEAMQHLGYTKGLLDQIHRGWFGVSDASPMQTMVRALAGYSRTTRNKVDQYLSSSAYLLKDVYPDLGEAGRAMYAAVEDDTGEKYNALPPEAKLVVDQWRIVSNALRRERQQIDPQFKAIGNFMYRPDVRPKARPSGGVGITSGTERAHREEALQLEGDPADEHIILGQAFKTVQEANAALAAQRKKIIENLMDTGGVLAPELRGNAEAEDIHNTVDYFERERRAKALALAKYAPKSDDFFDAISRRLPRDIQHMRTMQALNMLKDSIVNAGTKEQPILAHAAQQIDTKSGRTQEMLQDQGYTTIRLPGAGGWMIHGKLAKELEPYLNHLQTSVLEDNKAWQQLLHLERNVVASIMLSPLPHSANVAGRMLALATQHPIEMTRFLLQGKATSLMRSDEEAQALRDEAHLFGVAIRGKRLRGYGENVQGHIESAYSDLGDDAHTEGRLADIKAALRKPLAVSDALNNVMWSRIMDFAVAAYHIEKQAALHSPVFGAGSTDIERNLNASFWAAKRANSWAGFVLPEDTNPLAQKVAETVLFAPNWWRTWGELMFPVYRNHGMSETEAAYRALSGAKSVMALTTSAYMTANVLNYMLTSTTPWSRDGHWLWQNQVQPWNPGRVEATAPWLNNMPMFSGTPAIDPKTGGRRTMENPLARQMGDTITAMGLTGGLHGWTPHDMTAGMEKEIIGRLSPIMDSAFAMANIDLYRTASDGQLRHIDPTSSAPDITSTLAAMMFLTPGGIDFSNAIGKMIQQGQKQGTHPGPFGTKIPNGLTLQTFGNEALDGGIAWLTGINPPYTAAKKTPGQSISDQDYQKVQVERSQYAQQMSVLSAELFSGQITPQQWHDRYKNLSQQHAAAMNALFAGSPEYAGGPEGLLTQYEALYDQATNPDGSVNYDELDALQTQFKSEHTADEMAQMNKLLRQNDQKYPALKQYHDVINGYHSWQQDWSARNNVDINELRKSLFEYDKAYYDPIAMREFNREHPGMLGMIKRFEAAKRREFDRSQEGIMYALYFGGSRVVGKELQSFQLTESQAAEAIALQQMQQAPVDLTPRQQQITQLPPTPRPAA